jgi:hypothetical protein
LLSSDHHSLYKKKFMYHRDCTPWPWSAARLPHIFLSTMPFAGLFFPPPRVLPHYRTAAAAWPREAALTRLMSSPLPWAPILHGWHRTCPVTRGSTATHQGPCSRTLDVILLLHRNCIAGSRYAVFRGACLLGFAESTCYKHMFQVFQMF